jgi:hypothetical protein
MTPHEIIEPLREQHEEGIQIDDITDIEEVDGGCWVEVRLWVGEER